MSIFSQDEEFMDNIKKQPPSSLSNTDQSKAEKELADLQLQKQKQLLQQNQIFLNDLFQDNSTQPIRIKNVQITNGEQYRDSFIAKQFEPLLENKVLSLENYLHTIESISKNFMKLGIVENILCNTHQINQQNSNGFVGFKKNLSGGSAINVVPVFNVLPIKKFMAKTGTNIGNGEGDGYIQFQLRNIFGGAENLTFDAITGTKTSSSYLINFNQPINSNADYIFDSSVSINSRKLDWIQSNVHSKNLINKIYTQYNNSFLNHEIILENSLKNLDNYGSKSFQVMKQCGESIKSSIAYNLIYDSRNNKHLPFKGTLFQLGIEYNGIFKKFNKYPFLKIASLSQTAYHLPWINSHLLYTNKCGLLYSLAKNGETSILDRFYIGGPNDVRAFTLNGLGPKDKNSFIGGDLFSVGGVSIFTDIPYYKESNFKFHNFINWGKIVKYNQKLTLLQNFKKLGGSYCLSCGFGILYNHPMARFELNFVLPLVANENDSIRKGIQYGIGVSFL
ncbi:SAM50 [Candida pseudojiufengensis]|uniref:SAM50 n=1 Tax=Candida pseudojiufengensis TaxID=497109 RepID=UPI00222415F5|nr:SAM50 [Candida pseudojiufengensis]KAI5961646.1 SAM50 [Candida pseudojiufengensis]